MGYRILTLNSISVRGLERLPRDRYEVASELNNPHGVLLRSADMHKFQVPDRCWPWRAPAPAPTTSR